MTQGKAKLRRTNESPGKTLAILREQGTWGHKKQALAESVTVVKVVWYLPLVISKHTSVGPFLFRCTKLYSTTRLKNQSMHEIRFNLSLSLSEKNSKEPFAFFQIHFIVD